MGSWYTCNLGDPLLAGPVIEKIHSWYAAPVGTEGETARGSAYYRHESRGRPHCELHVYLAPGAEALALLIGARPCARPAMEGLGHLAGGALSQQMNSDHGLNFHRTEEVSNDD